MIKKIMVTLPSMLLLLRSVTEWNEARKVDHRKPYLRCANLSGLALSEADLNGADLANTKLVKATFCGANLTDATL
ncbi:MAG: pentapeptide repeat-containing protein [Geobacteraceae bacterium]|nr:pentapeptide repeat-containing protein [Geobacteraceae bacterium]